MGVAIETFMKMQMCSVLVQHFLWAFVALAVLVPTSCSFGLAWLGLSERGWPSRCGWPTLGHGQGRGKDEGEVELIFLHVALCQFVVLVSAFRIVGLFLIVVVVLLRFASVGWPE